MGGRMEPIALSIDVWFEEIYISGFAISQPPCRVDTKRM
jgi:hypothetical protein